MPSYHSLDVDAELSVLQALTTSDAPQKSLVRARDSDLDPLLLAAAFSSGPHVTRNHYAHDFFPAVGDPRAPGAWDWTKWTGEDPSSKQDPAKVVYVSRQAPRKQRLRAMGVPVDEEVVEEKENARHPFADVENSARLGLPPFVETHHGRDDKSIPINERLGLPSLVEGHSFRDDKSMPVNERLGLPLLVETHPPRNDKSMPVHERPGLPPSPELEVKCMARTRIPTTHGPVFLHLYHNNQDHKEHLAIVIDPAQLSDNELPSDPTIPPIRSRSLDAIWNPNETVMERITRGAYVGKLSSKTHRPSIPIPNTTSPADPSKIPPPLVRIHSECFTGETIGSMRCDCGEQLDEAIRLISQPITIPSPKGTPKTIQGRGAVIYLRQEGRGIGLLSKIRAYNLQDLGHDTVTANIMLGHKADERGYELAGAILRDLGLGSEGVRLLTNNPDKVQALEMEGLKVAERVPMIPRSWKKQEDVHSKNGLYNGGATLIGGELAHGQELDKYLRTKVLKMGHMLPLLDHDDEILDANGIMYV